MKLLGFPTTQRIGLGPLLRGPLFRVFFFVKEDEELGGGAREEGGTDRYKALQGRVALKP